MKLSLSLTVVLTVVANPASPAAAPSLHVEARDTCPQRPSDAIRIFRADKPKVDHFYSTDNNEIVPLITSSGYKRLSSPGNIFPTQVAGTVALHRLYLRSRTDHNYTASSVGKQAAIAAGYRDDGVIGYLLQNGGCKYKGFMVSPLSLLYSKGETANLLAHDAAEKAMALADGYKDAGTLGYVIVPCPLSCL